MGSSIPDGVESDGQEDAPARSPWVKPIVSIWSMKDVTQAAAATQDDGVPNNLLSSS